MKPPGSSQPLPLVGFLLCFCNRSLRKVFAWNLHVSKDRTDVSSPSFSVSFALGLQELLSPRICWRMGVAKRTFHLLKKIVLFYPVGKGDLSLDFFFPGDFSANGGGHDLHGASFPQTEPRRYRRQDEAFRGEGAQRRADHGAGGAAPEPAWMPERVPVVRPGTCPKHMKHGQGLFLYSPCAWNRLLKRARAY